MDSYLVHMPVFNGQILPAVRLNKYSDVYKLTKDELAARQANMSPHPFGYDHVATILPVTASTATAHLPIDKYSLLKNTNDDVFLVEGNLHDLRTAYDFPEYPEDLFIPGPPRPAVTAYTKSRWIELAAD